MRHTFFPLFLSPISHLWLHLLHLLLVDLLRVEVGDGGAVPVVVGLVRRHLNATVGKLNLELA